MRILLVHNYYIQPGGEDTVFESDMELFRSHGHDVTTYVEHNQRISSMSRFSVASETFWSRPTYNNIKEIIRQYQPDIAQFYNTFPLISPAAYYACRKFDIPIIQYLFNPRLMCPAASLYRAGHLCTDCIDKFFPWPGVVHSCYHNSRVHTLTVASMLAFHRFIGTWQDLVNVYISATNFYRNLYVRGGLPAEKIVVKPNYISYDPDCSTEASQGAYALVVGRLDPEKGINTLLNAWKTLDIPLKIRGDGQLEHEARNFVSQNSIKNVEFIGRLERKQLIELIRNSRFLIWPSEGYYETFGLAAVECFAQGVPVIASDIGVMREIVQDRETGLLFNPGDPSDLASKVEWLWKRPEESRRLGNNARKEYKEKYTAEGNYQMLMKIYNQVLQNKSGSNRPDQRHGNHP